MFIKLIIFSVVIVSFVMLAMGLRLLLEKKAEFKHSCGGTDCACDMEESKICDH